MMTVPGLGEPFHFGLVVDDLPSAMAELGDGLGLTWTAVQTMTNLQHSRRHGLEQRTRSFVFCLQQPHIELLQTAPDSVWEHTGLHHSAYWVEDLNESAQRLERLGFIREVTSFALCPGTEITGHADTSTVIATYHRHPGSSLIVELCSRSIRADMERLLAGAEIYHHDAVG
jgi:hypothetical protein